LSPYRTPESRDAHDTPSRNEIQGLSESAREREGGREEEEEEEEGLFKADAVNEEDPERDRATQV